MKKTSLIWGLSLFLALLALFMNGTTLATSVLFDFEDAQFMGGAGEIEEYMESVYSSDVTVIGGRVANWSPGPHGPFGPGPLGPDNYIHAGPDYCPSSWFSFSFNEVPITSASFDWGTILGVEGPIPMIVYSFDVFADDVEIFSVECGFDELSGNTDVLFFNSPITTLKFTVNPFANFEIEVDNLTVTSVPEPATIALMGLGALGFIHRRRP